jgi:hypothetical protein
MAAANRLGEPHLPLVRRAELIEIADVVMNATSRAVAMTSGRLLLSV